ncbi:MAG: RnfABCDGE type electron transport complex subunit D [Pseudomonadota bacterium]
MMRPTHAPHAHEGSTVARTMQLVMLALTPATLFAFWLNGWPALLLWLVTVASAVLAEFFYLRASARPAGPTLADGSAVLTGWLLALSLPAWAPWWVGALGSVFAIIVVKQVFGGLGQNLFNPAMMARAMLLIAFPVELTTWVQPAPWFSGHALGLSEAWSITFLGQMPSSFDALTGATTLGHVKTELTRHIAVPEALAAHGQSLGAGLFGLHGGSLGETAALLLALGGLALIALRVITWHIPLAMIAGLALPALLLHAHDPAHYLDAATHVLAGGLILGAFFIATDPVTSPGSPRGQLIFGFGCGLLTWLIRTYGGYPEAVAFAVLLMNGLTPVIDRYARPRIYGHAKKPGLDGGAP